MGSDFNKAVEVILKHEGGWVDNPADPGGETNYGISMLIVRREGITPQMLGIPNFDRGSMKLMSKDAARAIYKKVFWDRYGYEKIFDQRVATKLFDCAVNCGPMRAVRMAQLAANQCGQALKDDGILGVNTFVGLNNSDPDRWLKAMCDEMTAYYTGISQRTPKLKVFLSNWLKRAKWIG